MKALLAALALLLLGALWFVAFGHGGAAPDLGPSTGPAGEQPAAGAGPRAAEVAGEPALDSAGADDAAGSDARSEIDLGARADDSELRAATVRVVLKDGGDAVPGAEVRYLRKQPDWAAMDADERRLMQSLQVDQERYLAHFGHKTLADEHGEALLRLKGERTSVTARKGDLYGQAGLNLQEEPDDGFEVELEPDLGFRVLVVGEHDGEPLAGVKVVADTQTFQTWNQRVQRAQHELGTSDGDGLVEVRHVQLWRVHEQDGRRDAALRPRIAGAKPEPVSVDVNQLPAEPVRLGCPQVGTILVKAVDARGALVEGHAWVQLVPVEPDGSRSQGGQQDWNNDRRTDGRIELANVALGRTFELSVWIGGEQVSEKVAGPVRPGQEVEVVLARSGDSIELCGRTVDAGGTPRAKQQLRLDFQDQDSGQSDRAYVVTDERGAFRHVLGAGWLGKRPKIEIRALDSSYTPTGINGQVAIDGGLGKSRNDVGDVILREAALLVAGRAVDRAGGSGVKAQVRVEHLQANPPGRPGRAESWRRTEFSARVEDDGTFEVRGEPPSGRLRLRVASQKHLPVDPIDFAPGTTDLVVELTEGGTLTANVVHDELMPAASLRLELIPRGGATDKRATDAGAPPDFGYWDPGMMGYGSWGGGSGNRNRGQARDPKEQSCEFHWQGLEPGTYRLEVTPLGAGQPVAVVEDIEIVGGEKTDDARLDPLDLRGALHLLKVRVVDAAGNAVQDYRGGVLLRQADPRADLEGHRLRGEQVVFLTAEPYVDLLVAVRGYRVAELNGAHGEVTVKLHRGIEVQLHVDKSGVELQDGVTLRLALHPEAGPGGPGDDPRKFVLDGWRGGLGELCGQGDESVDLDASGRGSVTLREAGTYRATVSVRRRQAEGRSRSEQVHAAEVRVADTDVPQRIDIEVTADDLRKTLEKLIAPPAAGGK